MEFPNHFSELNPNLNFQSFMGLSNESFFLQQDPEFPGNFMDIFNHYEEKTLLPLSITEPIVSADCDFHESKKRKGMELSDSSSGISSPPVSDHSSVKKKHSSGRGKKVKKSEKEEEKRKEVVHVRARRGQATDSHSLAERARRGKINERLRCLQDIVPGCYKTMGMAVMLDEIINYVQSLQNQVEFLSMKLTAASTFYDFNAETNDFEAIQGTKALHEAQKVQKVGREGYEELVSSTQTVPFDHTFGCYPSFPYNT